MRLIRVRLTVGTAGAETCLLLAAAATWDDEVAPFRRLLLAGVGSLGRGRGVVWGEGDWAGVFERRTSTVWVRMTGFFLKSIFMAAASVLQAKECGQLCVGGGRNGRDAKSGNHTSG